MDDLLVVVVVVVVVNVAWTVLVRTFPAVLTATLTKAIEHRYATRLSRLKADLDAHYSTLKSSVDFLSASQSDLRTRAIASVESLWTAVLEIEREHSDLVFVDDILVSEEIRDLFASGRIKKHLADYSDTEVVTKKMERFMRLTSERERLFSGEPLWLRFSTFCRAHGRMAVLAQFSFEKGTYVDWRTDDLMNTILRAILAADVLERAKSMRIGGFREVTGYLKAEFLKEAIRVMSGSQHVADSLSDVQSTLLSQQKRLTTDRSERESMLRPGSGWETNR